VVAQLFRLKLQLLGNSSRRSTWQLVVFIIGLVYGLGASIFAIVSLVTLRLADVEDARAIVVVAGSAVVLGYLLLPLLYGADDTMDPRKFSLFGMPTSRLSLGLAVAALVSIPSVVITIVGVAQIVTWSRSPLAMLLSLVSAVLIVATCVLASRVTTSVAALLLSTRRARDATAITALVVLLLLSPVFALLINVDWRNDGLQVLRSVAAAASWTPIGAVWAAPADAAAGDAGAAVLKTLIALAFVGVLWVAWRALVAAMLVSPPRLAPVKTYRGLGWFEWFPATPTGAIAARSLTYWARDSRYHVSLLVIPILPVILVIPLIVAGVPPYFLALLPVPIVALFLGWSAHNDVAYDNSAIWLHVASHVRGSADRFGRVVPALLIGVPVVIGASFIFAPLAGAPGFVPAMIGAGLCLLLVGLGLSSVMSARFPYPVVHPGDSPFAQPQSSGTAASLTQSISFFVTIALSAPTLWFATRGFLDGGDWIDRALWLGIGSGLAAFVIGIFWGGWIFTRRSPELLAFSVRN